MKAPIEQTVFFSFLQCIVQDELKEVDELDEAYGVHAHAESVRRHRNGWITRRWSFGPLLPRFLQEREEDSLTKSTVLFVRS
jgi:hypothetical protein